MNLMNVLKRRWWIAVMVLFTAPIQAQVSNDNFSGATPLPSIFARHSETYSTAGASLEPSEPAYAITASTSIGTPTPTLTNSLWWKWTPQYSFPSRVDSGSAHLFVFKGTTLETLESVADSKPTGWWINAWGGVSRTGGASFLAEAGQTYWLAAVSTNPDQTNTWSLEQPLHTVSADASAYVGHAWTARVTGSLDLAPPSAMTVVLGHYAFPNPPTSYPPRTVWTPLFSTNLSNGPAFEWSWIPDEVGEYEVLTARQYDGSNFVSQTLNVTVRPSNDAFDFADIIHPSAASTNLAFRTDWSSAEASEPDSWTNSPQRSLWWKWTPDHAASVRFKAVVDGLWGLPVDIFTGTGPTNLTRIANNDSRTLVFPLEGLVPLNATAGTTYFIRVCDSRPDGSRTNPTNYFQSIPTVRTNLSLTLEPGENPPPGVVALTTTSGTPQLDGSIAWEAWARVFQSDGVHLATNNFSLVGQFYIGTSLGDLHPFGRSVSIINSGPAEILGSVFQSLAGYPGVREGDTLFVQLRAWDGGYGASYETVRTNGGWFGRSGIITVKAGSELTGPALPMDLSDVVLAAAPAGFSPGTLAPESSFGDQQMWRLTAPAGFLYAIETGDSGSDWQTLLILTNYTGTVTFEDPRTLKLPVTFYRSRIID